jgi:alpha-1,2-mannosyltransferase
MVARNVDVDVMTVNVVLDGVGTRRPRLPPALVVLGLGLLLAILAATVAAVIYRHNAGWMYDAKVYRTGGSTALHGRDVYSSSIWPGFTYTPFAALLFVPLSLPPLGWAAILWTAASMLCLEASAWLCLGQLGVTSVRLRLASTALVCVLAVWLDPVSATLLAGQVNVIVMFAVLMDLTLPDGNRWQGVALGVVAGIKLIPAFFILYLLLTRRFRAAAVAIAAFGATVAVGFVGLTADSARYWGGLFLQSGRVGDPQNVRSQSLRSVVVRWAHTSQGIDPIWIALCVAVVVVALAVGVWAHRREDELLAVCVCASATLLISPITWQHHWVWLLPTLVWLAARAWRSRSGVLWVALAAAAADFYARPYLWGIPVDKVADLHLDTRQLVVSSTYAAAAIAFLAWAGITRPTTRRLPASEPEAVRART